MKKVIPGMLIVAFLLAQTVAPAKADAPLCTFETLVKTLLVAGVQQGPTSFSIGFTDATWRTFAKAMNYGGESSMTSFAKWLSDVYGAKAIFQEGAYDVTFSRESFRSPCKPQPTPPAASAGGPPPIPVPNASATWLLVLSFALLLLLGVAGVGSLQRVKR